MCLYGQGDGIVKVKGVATLTAVADEFCLHPSCIMVVFFQPCVLLASIFICVVNVAFLQFIV